MNKRVLVVESHADVARPMVQRLRTVAKGVDQAEDGRSALLMAQSADYDLIVLELVLPRLGGRSLCEALAAQGSGAPRLAVTARADLIPALLGIKGGVDDYLIKPFHLDDLQERARKLMFAHAPRFARAKESGPAQVGDLIVDVSKSEVTLQGKPLRGLSTRDVDVLHFLARNPGLACSREELLAAIWGIRHPIGLECTGVNLVGLRIRLRASDGHQYLAVTRDGLARNPRYFVAVPKG